MMLPTRLCAHAFSRKKSALPVGEKRRLPHVGKDQVSGTYKVLCHLVSLVTTSTSMYQILGVPGVSLPASGCPVYTLPGLHPPATAHN